MFVCLFVCWVVDRDLNLDYPYCQVFRRYVCLFVCLFVCLLPPVLRYSLADFDETLVVGSYHSLVVRV